MKLVNLVKNKNQISVINDSRLIAEYEKYISSLVNVVVTCDPEYTEFVEKLNQDLNDLKNVLSHTKSLLNDLNSKIKQDIDRKINTWDTEGYTTDNGNQYSACTTYELERSNRITIPSDSSKQKVLSVIQKYTNPSYACLEIGPGDGEWTPLLVASDPLYLVDIHQEFLDSTSIKFPEQYRRRLRQYLLDFSDPYNLDKLPQNQFGFIFSWNVFDYFPAQQTKQYLESCFKILRPGGRMLFSYNNCNTVIGVNFAEIGNKSWMTDELILSICTELGFEIEINTIENESWVCIKKPGALKTVKTHQALGEIKNYSR
jgi:SAM-dependent methyltransferase